MIKNNYFSDNEDLVTHFNELIDWKEVVEAYEGPGFSDAQEYEKTGNERQAFAPATVEDAVEYYRATMDAVGELSGHELAQYAQVMDHKGLKFENGKVIKPAEMLEVYEKFKAAGLLPFKNARDYGGLGLPASAHAIFTEVVTRADTSFGMTMGLMAVSEIIAEYGTHEQAEEYVTKVTAGDYVGSMSLTEPNYGSDLSSVQTKAVKQEDGSYKLTGTKRFISQGCGMGEYPSVILTLARTGAPGSGARGLSLFIVKSTDVEIASIEHKMGIHCSPTCEVVYDNSHGEIIGREGFGLTRYAMGMMNDARISVAALGIGVGCAAYYEGAKYASEREQFGRTIDQIPAVRRMLDRMERENVAMRLLTGEAGRGIDLSLYRKRRMEKDGMEERALKKDEELRRWDRLASLFTPMAKFYCSEKGVELASDGIQIHGGAGYTEEYDVARIYRDSRINTVYEGTTQLQVVAAIGGITAGMSSTGFFRRWVDDEMARSNPSDFTRKMLEMLEESIEIYKGLDGQAEKDRLAFEVVNIACRFASGLLFDRAVTRVSADKKERFERMARDYHIDSVAQAQGDLYRMREGSKVAAAV